MRAPKTKTLKMRARAMRKFPFRTKPEGGFPSYENPSPMLGRQKIRLERERRLDAVRPRML